MKRFFLLVILGSVLTKLSALEIYAHRGGAGLFPENSLEAYSNAISLGVDVIDMDVMLNKNKTLIVFHDPYLHHEFVQEKKGNYIPHKKLFIKKLSLSKIKQYEIGKLKAGSKRSALYPEQKALDNVRIPTLKEAIAHCDELTKGNIRYQIEVKSDPFYPECYFPPKIVASRLCSFLKKRNLIDRVEVQSFDWRVLLEIRKKQPSISLAFLQESETTHKETLHFKDKKWSAGYDAKDFDFCTLKMIQSLGGKIWGPEHTLLTKERVEKAKKLGLKVVPWTINDPLKMEQYLEYGVDAIITDRPDILRDILLKKKLLVPKKI